MSAVWRRSSARRPDLVILDLMLPRLDGFEVFRRIRSVDPESPVLMLTARGQETDRVVGLDSGADDYVTKPCSPREIVARVRAILRRTGQTGPSPGEPQPALRFGDLEIDPGAARGHPGWCAARADAEGVRPSALLRLAPRGSPSAGSSSSTVLWDAAYDGDPSTVTVHVRRLREKIEADPADPRRLVTVWGAGYRFEP